MIKKLRANIFLAFYLLLHIFRKPFRYFRRKGWRDHDFLRYYKEDHIRSFSKAEREWWFEASTCVHCGLCALTSPEGRLKGKILHFDPRSFILAESRGSTEFWAVEEIPAASFIRAEAICPFYVPFKKIVARVNSVKSPL